MYTEATISIFGGLSTGEHTASCASPNDVAISGGDIPVGVDYNSTAADFGEYITEWSGPASNNQWDWYFSNASPESITMEFIVYCEKSA